MNPVQAYSSLRYVIKNYAKKATDKFSKCAPTVSYKGIKHAASTNLFKGLLNNWKDVQSFLPAKEFDGSMDIVCSLSSGKTLIEMQVIPEDYFDKRQLVYAAKMYSSQLKSGGKWKDIKKIISISILGGRRERDYTWSQEFKRHYKLREQTSHDLLPEGIEILQYSILRYDETSNQPQNMTDWITFLTRAHLMESGEVSAKIKEPGVLKAFQMAIYEKFPQTVKKVYLDENTVYSEKVKEESREEGRREASLLIANTFHIDIDEINKALDLPPRKKHKHD